MQLQMEVCDLDECDFLETQFVEFESYKDYTNALINNTNNNDEVIDQKPINKEANVVKSTKISSLKKLV